MISAGYSSLTSQCSEAGERAGTMVALQDGGTTQTFSEHPRWSQPPHSQPQFMPRKIPQLLNFSGATVTSCGFVLGVLYMEMFVPVSSASACAETGSLNSSGIHSHLLSTSLDLTAK